MLGEAGYELASDGERPGGDAAYPSRVARNAWVRRALGRGDALAHLGTMAASKLAGEDFIAVHMTWGAVNELSTLTGYHRLVAETDHPVLVDLLGRIIKDERRHFAFYRAQARMRLASSRRARRLTRWALRRLWAPVGTGVRPQAETDFVVTALFDGDARDATTRGVWELLTVVVVTLWVRYALTPCVSGHPARAYLAPWAPGSAGGRCSRRYQRPTLPGGLRRAEAPIACRRKGRT